MQPQLAMPWATIGLIVLCVIIFVCEPGDPVRLNALILEFGCTPVVLFGHELPNPEAHHVPRLLTPLTSAILHADVLHLLGNMFFLWLFGKHLKDSLDWPFFLVFVVVCAVVSSLGQAIADPHSPASCISASGFISVIMGGYLVIFPRARLCFIDLSLFPFGYVLCYKFPAWTWIGGWVAAQFVGMESVDKQLSQNIAYVAHLTGFGGGAMLAWILAELGVAATYAEDMIAGGDDAEIQ